MNLDPNGDWVIVRTYGLSLDETIATPPTYLKLLAPVAWGNRLATALRFSNEADANAVCASLGIQGIASRYPQGNRT